MPKESFFVRNHSWSLAKAPQRTALVPRCAAAGVVYCAPHSAILLGTDLAEDFYDIDSLRRGAAAGRPPRR